MGESILIIGIVEDREFALRTALERGLHLTAIDFATSRLMQLAHNPVPVADLFDPAQLRDALARTIHDHRPDAVMTFYDELLEPTARVARELGSRFLSPDAARRALNKVAQRAALRDGGLLCPRWVECDDRDSVRQAADEVGYPLIIKVADQAGSIGKVRVSHERDLDAAFELADATRIDRAVPMLVEELVVGKEFSIEGFVAGGEPTLICVTRKTTQLGPYPAVVGHALPYDGADASTIADAALRAALALGVDDSMIHAEVIVSERGPVIVEVNARSSGDRLMDMVHRASGCNPYHVAFDLALGRKPSWQPDWRGGEAMRYVVPDRPGVFTALDGIDGVLGDPDLRGIAFTTPIGVSVPARARHNGERLAWVICGGTDWRSADAKARELVASLRPRIVAPPDGHGPEPAPPTGTAATQRGTPPVISYTSATYGDKIADIYDQPGQCPDDAHEAAGFLAELARSTGNAAPQILEFGVGTGRIALPLAGLGCAVTGIDTSANMLRTCAAADTDGLLTLVHADMTSMAGPPTFDLVFAAYNTLFLAISQAEQMAAMANAYRHLVPGGHFVVQAFVPDPSAFTGNQRVRIYDLQDDYADLDLILHDPVAQLITTQYLIFRPDKTEFRPLKVRYCWPTELDLMARMAGFDCVGRAADWKGGHFSAASTDHVSVYRKPATAADAAMPADDAG